MAIRPAIFKWRQSEPAIILCAVRWYLRYSLSYRDVEELLEERGLDADHTTVWRWVPTAQSRGDRGRPGTIAGCAASGVLRHQLSPNTIRSRGADSASAGAVWRRR